MKREALFCPGCGARMNNHAEKMDWAEAEHEGAFGGRLLEVHQCPQCGAIADRDAGTS